MDLLEGIKEASADELLKDLIGVIFGLDPDELKLAVEYAAERTRFHSLLDEVSDLTNIRKTDLILSFDYSKDLSERISKKIFFIFT